MATPASSVLIAATGTTGVALAAYTAREHTYHALQQPPTHGAPPPASVSLIIKNLNEEEYIARCIESLLDQSIIKKYPEYFDILFVDGGSDDQSIEIAKRYPLQILTTTKGVLHQRNEGIEHTTGDILVFVDSDSYYPPYWLEKLLASFDDDVVMVHTSFLNEETDNLLFPLANLLRTLTGTASGGSQAIRRRVFEELGLFDESHDCVYFQRVFTEEELNIVTRASTLGRVVYQWDNPFISTMRRLNLAAIEHSCIRDPSSPHCKFAQAVGVTRF